ncbi:LADA_0H19240g1_1 [Lachancea dasiensis]|uniref:LADA_0H19240g1_1 n=1 Tax=Lachancea dasiensis TaxID=1072105 RepID=A0A1G4K6B1_9SACH|nr:LADA_0H19240g1_1 [Lachancea dasiensis]
MNYNNKHTRKVPDQTEPTVFKGQFVTSTPKGRQNNIKSTAANYNVITDRFIPQMASGAAFRSAQRLKTADLEDRELSPDVTDSPTHLSMPAFFWDLGSTLHYHSIDAASGTSTDSKHERQALNSFQKLYRQFVADALGFHYEDRVFQFSAAESTGDSGLTLAALKSSILYTPNNSTVDPLLSVLSPRQALSYLVSQTFSKSLRTRSLVPTSPRAKTRLRSHVPYRVLDAPSLRNDFYSNLISWSKVTGNIMVGLGCAVYLWSDKHGAVNVLEYSYLQSREDYVTCVSFSPFDRHLVVGTKQGRIMLFDQIDGEEDSLTDNKPLCVGNDRSISGVCCLEWIERDGRRYVVVGQENGYVHIVELMLNYLEYLHVQEMPEQEGENEIESYHNSVNNIHGGVDLRSIRKRLEDVQSKKGVFKTAAKFKAQEQQVCGLSTNKGATQLAVGGNDNSCTIWDTSDLAIAKLQFSLPHKAAVKAVAFCPWSKSLLATGGGSKDRNIRFWHTHSGTLLQEKKAPGQITSLIWSLRQKQIVATFGFREIECPTLVSVYSYPTMDSIVEVHSMAALRVLSAVSSPDFGSICVATNDETVRFYELWNVEECTILEAQERGIYGSDLIEYVEGIQKNYQQIR